MNESLRLMAILAHPDDESLGFGGTLAKYAAEGIHVALVTATRGERGWRGEQDADPGLTAVGQIREAELRSAATALGIDRLTFLDQIDGELAQAESGPVLARIVAEIRAFRPQVVVTFGPDGAYGHPDHIAISQLATSAVLLAADPEFRVVGDIEPVRVQKLYYRIWTESEQPTFTSVFGEVGMDIDGVRATGSPGPNGQSVPGSTRRTTGAKCNPPCGVIKARSAWSLGYGISALWCCGSCGEHSSSTGS